MNKKFLQTIGFGALILALMTGQTWAMEKKEKEKPTYFSVTQVTVNSHVVPRFAVDVYADEGPAKRDGVLLSSPEEKEPLVVPNGTISITARGDYEQRPNHHTYFSAACKIPNLNITEKIKKGMHQKISVAITFNGPDHRNYGMKETKCTALIVPAPM